MADKRQMELTASGWVDVPSPLAEGALSLLEATDARAVAAALLRGLAACGVSANAVVWQAQDHVACEPAGALSPEQELRPCPICGPRWDLPRTRCQPGQPGRKPPCWAYRKRSRGCTPLPRAFLNWPGSG